MAEYKPPDVLDKLLSGYRFWGLAAIFSFAMFVLSLIAFKLVPGINFILLLLGLLSGFLWLGATSFCRHSLVILKEYIGREISVLEFLSTQLVVFLFPLEYRKVRKEIKAYREKISREN